MAAIRYPSFAGFRASSKASSNAKKANRSTNTVAELRLHAALRELGLRFRTHSISIPGKPDVVFRSAKVAVFCDGDFWHGRNWRRLRQLLEKRANADYWIAKIGANRRRDASINKLLEAEGWLVLRCWETDVRADAAAIANHVARILRRRQRKGTGRTGPKATLHDQRLRTDRRA